MWLGITQLGDAHDVLSDLILRATRSYFPAADDLMARHQMADISCDPAKTDRHAADSATGNEPTIYYLVI